MSKRRVVVTGLGVVSSIGIGKDEFWNNLIAGKSGISEVTTFSTSGYDNHVGGEVKNFNPLKFITRRNVKEMERVSQFAVSAAKMALEDARLSVSKAKKGRIGVVVGTTMAGIQSLEQIDKHWMGRGEDDVWAATVKKYPGNVLSDSIAYYFGINGPNYVIPTACAAGNYSAGYSFDLIKKGRTDVMLAGGADPFSRITFTGFSRLFAMSPDKCRPFDKNRKGIIIGEGAGIMILEELEHALKRRVPIYAEILGYGLSCDAHHMTSPTEKGVRAVMEKAIKNSRIKIEEVDYICAHGTGTPSNDKIECSAIKSLFGDLTRDIPVTSIKSMLGHTMGAASAIEAITCCLAVKNDIIPPTINYETPDPCCDVDCIPNNVKEEVNIVLNNSLAFGGNNACLVLKNYE